MKAILKITLSTLFIVGSQQFIQAMEPTPKFMEPALKPAPIVDHTANIKLIEQAKSTLSGNVPNKGAEPNTVNRTHVDTQGKSIGNSKGTISSGGVFDMTFTKPNGESVAKITQDKSGNITVHTLDASGNTLETNQYKTKQDSNGNDVIKPVNKPNVAGVKITETTPTPTPTLKETKAKFTNQLSNDPVNNSKVISDVIKTVDPNNVLPESQRSYLQTKFEDLSKVVVDTVGSWTTYMETIYQQIVEAINNAMKTVQPASPTTVTQTQPNGSASPISVTNLFAQDPATTSSPSTSRSALPELSPSKQAVQNFLDQASTVDALNNQANTIFAKKPAPKLS